MAASQDELALRAALDELTTGQPPPPAGRYRAVRHRVARNRIRQVSFACGAVVLAAAAVITGTRLDGRLARPAAASARHLPAWALPWPDHRNGSVPQRVLDGAVTAWRYLANPDDAVMPQPTRVIWYVGQILPGSGDVVVVFEVDSVVAGRQLVVGEASRSEVMAGQPAWSDGSSPWVLDVRSAPDPRQRGLAVGFNDASDVALASGRSPDNLIAVLAGPQVRRITWLADTTTGPRSGNTVTSAGLAVADTGQVTARVQLTGLLTGSGNALSHPVFVGAPVSAGDTGPPSYPVLAPPPPLRLPPSYRFIFSASGSDSTADNGLGTHGPRQPGQQVAVFARCYGPAPLALRIGSVASGGLLLGVVRCDDGQQKLLIPAGQRLTNKTLLSMQTGPLTSYLVEVAATR
jgi:hypothetical protein